MDEYPVDPAKCPSARDITATGSRSPAAWFARRSSIQSCALSMLVGAGVDKYCHMDSSAPMANRPEACFRLNGSRRTVLPSRVTGRGRSCPDSSLCTSRSRPGAHCNRAVTTLAALEKRDRNHNTRNLILHPLKNGYVLLADRPDWDAALPGLIRLSPISQ